MPAAAKPIYVEIIIRGSVDRVWQLTQAPDLHQRWDLRFTDIENLARPDPAEPQRFLYATRIGFGLAIRGEGETVGTHDGPDGLRSSALKFASADPKSLIRQGSGYWKYVPVDADGPAVRFLTGYGYDVRFGAAGRIFDRCVFRPLMGWATAWSFDRLRLWVERGTPPEASLRAGGVHAASRACVAFVWAYQGLVPKLIARHPDELAMLRSGGLSPAAARMVCVGAGLAEVAVGAAIVIAWRSRWPLWLTVMAMPAALVAVAIGSPGFLSAAFNPVTLNVATFALALVALVAEHDAPSSGRCLRRPTKSEGP